jgi:hypothetical protein
MATLSALVSGLDGELRRLGYNDSTLVRYRAAGVVWRGSSLPVASRSSRWTWRLRGSMRRAASSRRSGRGTLKPNDVYLFGVAQMLGDYAVHGAVLRRYCPSVGKLAGEGAA